MLKAEILSRLWLATYGFHDYIPDGSGWASFEKFLIEWCSEKFEEFNHPGIQVCETEAHGCEDKFVAGIPCLKLPIY